MAAWSTPQENVESRYIPPDVSIPSDIVKNTVIKRFGIEVSHLV